jgi:hypothetical protein
VVAHPPERNREIGHLAVRRNLWHRGHYATAWCSRRKRRSGCRSAASRPSSSACGTGPA